MNRLLWLMPFVLVYGAHAQITDPVVTSWVLNTTNETGFNGIPSNVLQVQYSTQNVYVSCTCIPGYDIGPWAGNPNTPANQDFTFKITRNPLPNTGTLVNTPLGHVGVFRNGVSIFNAKDAFSYNNQGIWNQDALPNEGASFDDCLGHPAPNGEYHHHVNPTCLYDDDNSSVHSPIIGYAFDGYPIYGAYGFENTDGTGAVLRMRSSYQLRNITERTTLPDGTVLNAGQYGPPINAQYPMGKYLEDYEYVPGLGTLDEHNGRICSTPEYPAGTYAYFVTVDEEMNPVYPYTLGATYYGTVQPGNTGPQSGHNTPGVNEDVETYNPVGIAERAAAHYLFWPNPAQSFLAFSSDRVVERVSWYALTGQFIREEEVRKATGQLSTELLEPGMYLLELHSGSAREVVRVVVE